MLSKNSVDGAVDGLRESLDVLSNKAPVNINTGGRMLRTLRELKHPTYVVAGAAGNLYKNREVIEEIIILSNNWKELAENLGKIRTLLNMIESKKVGLFNEKAYLNN